MRAKYLRNMARRRAARPDAMVYRQRRRRTGRRPRRSRLALLLVGVAALIFALVIAIR